MSVASDDPLQTIMRPPRNETVVQKQDRINDESMAKKRSEQIDRYLKEDSSRIKKERANERTILLLGQAGAGKTTILKQMRLIYAAERQDSMRQAWTDVIYLNVIMAIKLLLDTLEGIEALELECSEQVMQGMNKELCRTKSLGCFSVSSDAPSMKTMTTSRTTLREPSKFLLARLRLAPFLSIETELRKKLRAFERDGSTPASVNSPQATTTATATLGRPSFSSSTSHGAATGFGSVSLRKHQHEADLLLRAGWQEEQLPRSSASLDLDSQSVTGSATSSSPRTWRRPRGPKLIRRNTSNDEKEARHKTVRSSGSNYVNAPKEDDPSKLLSASLGEIWELWEGGACAKIKDRLYRADSASYFLTNAARIARSDYCPIDDDILHARVRTIGATEEQFVVDKSLTYRIIDVGGSRFQRTVWAQLFEEATAIIFLAPISAFDEYLEEDLTMNRIADSLEIWRQVVVNPLLYNVSLILFLNKIDLLQKKLLSGIKIIDYFPDYRGKNEYEEAWRYFRGLFHNVVSEHRSSAPTRNLYVHKTTATSTKEIKVILMSTKDAILRHHLKESGFT